MTSNLSFGGPRFGKQLDEFLPAARRHRPAADLFTPERLLAILDQEETLTPDVFERPNRGLDGIDRQPQNHFVMRERLLSDTAEPGPASPALAADHSAFSSPQASPPRRQVGELRELLDARNALERDYERGGPLSSRNHTAGVVIPSSPPGADAPLNDFMNWNARERVQNIVRAARQLQEEETSLRERYGHGRPNAPHFGMLMDDDDEEDQVVPQQVKPLKGPAHQDQVVPVWTPPKPEAFQTGGMPSAGNTAAIPGILNNISGLMAQRRARNPIAPAVRFGVNTPPGSPNAQNQAAGEAEEPGTPPDQPVAHNPNILNAPQVGPRPLFPAGLGRGRGMNLLPAFEQAAQNQPPAQPLPLFPGLDAGFVGEPPAPDQPETPRSSQRSAQTHLNTPQGTPQSKTPGAGPSGSSR